MGQNLMAAHRVELARSEVQGPAGHPPLRSPPSRRDLRGQAAVAQSVAQGQGVTGPVEVTAVGPGDSA